MTSRSSSSAWRAAVWMSPAVRSISAGGRSDRSCSGTGVEGDQRHPVGDDVVHLAGDAGPFGLAGLVGKQPLLGLGARRARSWSDTTSCRRARTNIPATTAANMAVVVAVKIHHATGSPLIRTFCGRTRKNSPAVATLSSPMASAVCVRRCTATVNMAIVAATAVATEKIDSSAVSTATPTGNRRRSHSGTRDHPEHAVDDQHERRWGRLVGGRRAKNAAPTTADSSTQITSTVQSRPLRRMPPRLVVSPVEFEQGRRDQAGMVRACARPVDGNRAGHAFSLSTAAGAKPDHRRCSPRLRGDERRRRADERTVGTASGTSQRRPG